MQLHLSKLIFELGNIYCFDKNDSFDIEMETGHEGKSVDIVCRLGEYSAAIELKCFMQSSNRSKDIDCYDALLDIERLQNFSGFQIKKFICLTDNKYYPKTIQRGHGKTVTLNHGTIYPADIEIVPGWAGKWNINRNKPIIFKNDIKCNWVTINNWHYLKIDIL